MQRCHWATNELSIPYHDEEWGVPLHDDRKLFELLILEGAQAGSELEHDSGQTRELPRRPSIDSIAAKIARYDAAKIHKLLADPGIVRNRLKIASAVANAKAFLEVQDEFGGFDPYIWRFVGGRPKKNRWKSYKEAPARTAESDAMSKDLGKRGFKFVGSTICYAFMQAVGMVNDHELSCFRWKQVG